MPFRTVFVAFVALAAGANAQPHGQAPGSDRFESEGGRPPRDARLLGGFALEPGRVVKNAPYSAVMVTENRQVLPDGNRIRQTSTSRIYRDAEGRVRTEQSLGGLGSLAPNQSEMIFIHDPVAGVNYALNVRDKTATKSAWGQGGGASAQPSMTSRGRPGDRQANGAQPPGGRHGRGPDASAGPNVKTDMLGLQTIEGISADGRRTIETIPAGEVGNEQPIQIVSEFWYSPDLQVTLLSKHFDPRVGEIVFRLTNISRGAPAPSLFQPPADYQITEAGRGGRDQGQRK